MSAVAPSRGQRPGPAAVARTPWISGPRFDLALFFGASALGMGVPLLALAGIVSPVTLVWIYVAMFDGPHMMAGYSRTYLDKESRAQRPALLWGALGGGLAIPLFFAGLSATTHSDVPFSLFLMVMTFASYWHIVRQGWGIFALYRSREGARANVTRERALFYVAMYAPYTYFMFTHPAVRDTVSAPHFGAPWERAIAWLIAGATALSCAFFAAELLRARARTALAYGGLTIAFHAILYFVLARTEPLFPGARGPDQSFMMLTAAVSVAHATQYVALVGLHNRRRYGEVALHGIAARVAKSVPRYLATCLAFSLFYVVLTCATGIYPGCASLVGVASPPPITPAPTLARIALAVYWGIALQHYILDARIWRIKTDPALRKVLFRA